MAGPGRRGKGTKTATTAWNVSKEPIASKASNQTASASRESGSCDQFVTPNSSENQGPVDKVHGGEPQSSESGVAARENEQQDGAEMEAQRGEATNNDSPPL